MAKLERVVLANAAADDPAPFGTVAIALAALCAGFASAYALRDREGADDAKHASAVETVALPATAAPGTEAPAPPTVGAQEPAIPAAALEAAAESPPDVPPPAQQVEPSASPALARAQPPEEPPPAPAPAAAPIAARREEPRDKPEPRAGATVDPFADQRLKPGIVAYLRCDGLPQVKGPFPCPRDRALERRVWNALRSLERCAPLVDARGTSEVRLELTPLRTEVHVVNGELDRSAVRQCAAGLASARTGLRPTKMIVAFRFELR